MTWVKSRGKTWFCDGTADNVQIQAALDAIDSSSYGGEVVLSEGVFNLSGTIKFPRHMATIRGQNRNSTSLSASQIWALSNPDYALTQAGTVGQDHVHIATADCANFQVDDEICVHHTDGTGYDDETVESVDSNNGIIYLVGTLGSAHGLGVSYVRLREKSINIFDLKLQSCGMYLNDMTTSTFKRIYINGFNGYPVTCMGKDRNYLTFEDVSIVNSFGSGSGGIYVANADHVTIAKCTFSKLALSPILIGNASLAAPLDTFIQDCLNFQSRNYFIEIVKAYHLWIERMDDELSSSYDSLKLGGIWNKSTNTYAYNYVRSFIPDYDPGVNYQYVLFKDDADTLFAHGALKWPPNSMNSYLRVINDTSRSANLTWATADLGSPGVLLASDASSGQKNVVLVSGGTSKFREDEYIRIYDSDARQSPQAISSISGSTLTMYNNLSYSYHVAHGAKAEKLATNATMVFLQLYVNATALGSVTDTYILYEFRPYGYTSARYPMYRWYAKNMKANTPESVTFPLALNNRKFDYQITADNWAGWTVTTEINVLGQLEI